MLAEQVCAMLQNCLDESSSALDGMQPTRRQVPPRAGLPSLPSAGVDAGGLQAQLRGADRGVIAGRAGADDDDVEFVAHGIVLARSSRSLADEAEMGAVPG